MISRAVKTDGPTRLGPTLTGFIGPGQKIRLQNGLEIYYPSPTGRSVLKLHFLKKKL